MKKILLLLFLLNLSCGSSDKKISSERIIELTSDVENYPSFYESDYNMSFRIIPLELTDKSAITNIATLVKNDKYIYILDISMASRIFIFTAEGKFIKELEQGRAANELMGPTFFTIDRKSNNLEVLDRQTIMKTYSETGEFLNMIDLKLSHNEFARVGNKYILYNGNVGKGNGENYFTIYNIDNGKTDFFVKHCTGLHLAHFFPNHFSYHGDCVYFNSNYNNKIYRMSAEDVEPQIFAQVTNVFDGVGMTDMSQEKIQSLCGETQFSFFSSFNVLFDGDLFHLFLNKVDQLHSVFYDVKKNKAYKSIFEDLPYFTPLYSTNNTTIHEYNSFAFEKIDETKLPKELYDMMKQRYLKVGIDDNPYLIEVTYSRK